MIDLQNLKNALQAIDQSSVQYYSGKSFNAVAKWCLYAAGLGFIVFIFFCETIFPLHLLGKIAHSDTVIATLGSKADAQTFVITVKALLACIGFLLFYLGSVIGKLSAKNALLRKTAVTLGKFIGDNTSLASAAPLQYKLSEVQQRDLNEKIS